MQNKEHKGRQAAAVEGPSVQRTTEQGRVRPKNLQVREEGETSEGRVQAKR